MKKATAIEPETNELSAKRLIMEQLKMVSGGVIEEDNNAFRRRLVQSATIIVRSVKNKQHMESFEAFWDWAKNNHEYVLAQLKLIEKFDAAYYKSMSWGERYNVMLDAWIAS